jgi:hypothetical protein
VAEELRQAQGSRLDEAVKPMPLEGPPACRQDDRYYLRVTRRLPLCHDLQSLKEDDVVIAMLESKGQGKWLDASP